MWKGFYLDCTALCTVCAELCGTALDSMCTGIWNTCLDGLDSLEKLKSYLELDTLSIHR